MVKQKVNEHNILETLKKAGMEPETQPDTNQILVFFKQEETKFPLFIRILHDGELLQLMTFIPCNVDQEHAADLGRFMHMLNKELDMPGFGMDEESKTAFYRIMLPTLQKEFHPDALQAYIRTTEIVCHSFATMIEAVAIGAVSLEEIIAKADDLKERAKKASS